MLPSCQLKDFTKLLRLSNIEKQTLKDEVDTLKLVTVPRLEMNLVRNRQSHSAELRKLNQAMAEKDALLSAQGTKVDELEQLVERLEAVHVGSSGAGDDGAVNVRRYGVSLLNLDETGASANELADEPGSSGPVAKRTRLAANKKRKFHGC